MGGGSGGRGGWKKTWEAGHPRLAPVPPLIGHSSRQQPMGALEAASLNSLQRRGGWVALCENLLPVWPGGGQGVA